MYALNDNCMQKIYKAALYLRLSREDESLGQSESINNQRDYLTRYVLGQKWSLVDTYIDDGFTGTNFNRPDFKRMIADIESKKVNLVITKDLSRLGRDYIETGYYIERYFPEHNVRYIALNDGIDTFANNSNNDMSPFKSVINDLYAKDISRKVRTAFRTKIERGEFIGSHAPYGYKKSLNNKNAFVIDEEAALIIKRIFDMYVAGVGYIHIAKTLNREGIKPPSQYKKEINPNYTNSRAKYGLWTAETIRKILVNQVYIGNMVQHKTEKVSYKVKKFQMVNSAEHVIVENTHTPIVSADTFYLARKIMQSKPIYRQDKNDKTHLLSGLLYCGLCGHRMTFHKNSKNISYVICSKYKRFSGCQRNGVNEEKLNKEIIGKLRSMTKRVLNKPEIIDSIEIKKDDSHKNTIMVQINSINNRLLEIRKFVKGLYEDRIRGLLTEKDFLNLMNEFNSERDKLSANLLVLEMEQKKEEKIKEADRVLEMIRGVLEFEIIPKNMLVQLIDKIEINGTDNILIKYKFKNPDDKDRTL